VGVETLAASVQGLPKEFIRGCGIPEDLVASIAAHSIVERPRFYSTFLSYSHKDQAFVLRLYDRLQDAGVRCWLDEKHAKPGDDIYDAVERGIRDHERVLLCASKHSLTSWWVDTEIEAAFEKERTLMRETDDRSTMLIPLNLDDYMFSDAWKSGKRQIVRSRLAADFRDPAQFEQEFGRLVRSLRHEPTDSR
jgi:hypothetical protein